MIDEREIEKGLQWCVTTAEEAGEAKAMAQYLERIKSTIKAEIMSRSDEKSVAAREAWALCQPEYKTHLEAIKEAEMKNYGMQLKRQAIFAKAEAWRTQAANTRGIR